MLKRLSRREFLGTAMCTVGGLAFTPLKTLASYTSHPAPLSRASNCRVFADLHVHSMMNEWNARSHIARANPMLRLFGEIEINHTRAPWPQVHAAGIDLVMVAHYNVFDEVLSMATDPNPDAPMNTLRMMDMLEETLDDIRKTEVALPVEPHFPPLRGIVKSSGSPQSSAPHP